MTATITLKDVKVKSASGAAMEINGTSTVELDLVGENSLDSSGASKCAGVQFAGATSGSLTIGGSGSLTATGGSGGAGIGGGWKGTGRNITITGGTVAATGGTNGAGIGGGNAGGGSNITITGGDVTATGGSMAAGIGGGNGGSGSNITVSGGDVTAKGGTNGAGIGGGNAGSGSYITVSGGSVTATGNDRGAGIGGGNAGSGSNITVSGGSVTATGGSNGGAGIGGGLSKLGSDIAITGGAVTATGGGSGAGIGGGKGGTGSGIAVSGGTVTATGGANGAGIGSGEGGAAASGLVISGGSVKASSVADPTDGTADNNKVYLAAVPGLSGTNAVTVDAGTDSEKKFSRAGDHPGGDGTFYLYVTGSDHLVTAGQKTYALVWNGKDGFMVKAAAAAPAFTTSKTTTSIRATVEGDAPEGYGALQYRLDSGVWQPSGEFTNLVAGSTHTVYVRYGNGDTYGPSPVASAQVTTLKTGSVSITGPTTITYTGSAVSGPAVNKGQSTGEVTYAWYAVGEDGNETALASAPTDAGSYRVVASLASDGTYAAATSEKVDFTISKAASTATIAISGMDKTYDGAAVAAPSVETSGSGGKVTYAWYAKARGGWRELDGAPSGAGDYKVVATLAGDDNHEAATAEMEFSIAKAAPPAAETVPPSGLTVPQGGSLSDVELPEGWSWRDPSQRADAPGTHTFTAVYTPADADNYATVEVGVTVEVTAPDKGPSPRPDGGTGSEGPGTESGGSGSDAPGGGSSLPGTGDPASLAALAAAAGSALAAAGLAARRRR